MNTMHRTLKKGEKVILKSGVMRDEYDSLEWRTVEVAGDNFGNYEFTTGTCLFVKFKDGEIVRMSGLDIDPAATEKMTAAEIDARPKWDAEAILKREG